MTDTSKLQSLRRSGVEADQIFSISEEERIVLEANDSKEELMPLNFDEITEANLVLRARRLY